MFSALILAVATSQPIAIQQDTVTRPVAVASQRTGEIRIDGRLDEPSWQAAKPIERLLQQQPNEGAEATERTEVRFLFDDDALYIAARMHDSRGASGITRQLLRRDDTPESDMLTIDLDTYRDRLHKVTFQINPSGWRGDASDDDASWDPVWEGAATVDAEGWNAELRIPFSQLRFSRDSLQTWGLNLTRTIHRLQEQSQFAFWRKNDPGGPSYFGDLTGLRVVDARAHVEVLPYVVARTDRLNTADQNSPFYEPNPSSVRVGGDIKYRIASSYTLSATVNPDFGQVEVDPAVVNLSAYETFFSERRPFFVEGSDVFGFGQPGCNINCGFGLALFYSRRIGRFPQGADLAYDRGTYVELPENTAILGAAKLTGRSRSGFSLGVLNAVTGEEDANVALPDGRIAEQVVEPLTNNFVARAKQELRGGNLIVGGIVTSVNRNIDDEGLAQLLPNSAQSAGVDAEYFWDQHNWRAYAAVSGSRVAGDAAAITRVQESSARYLQRPDRETFTFDPTRTSLGGAGAIVRVAKEGGRWTGDFNAATNTAGFDFNDLGYLTTADWHWVNGTLGRRFNTPTKHYRSLSFMTGADRSWNYDGDNTGGGVTALAEYEFLNYSAVTIIGSRYFDLENDRLTRGGPVVGQPGSFYTLLIARTDPRRKLTLEASIARQTIDDGGRFESADLSAVIRPAANVRLSIGPGVRRDFTKDQYVMSVDDPTATEFYGSRYVFAHIDQRQVYMDTRTNVTFTPTLSFELFAQPLIASADYSNFSEFAAPRTQQKLIYGRDVGMVTERNVNGEVKYDVDPDAAGPAAPFTIDNPDFNLRSLRGTAVLRWEWRPGSTAYLVWTQTRSGVASVGDFNFGRDRNALFEAPGDNIFALKVSYWIGL